MLCFAHIPDLPDKNGEVCEKGYVESCFYKLIHAAGAFQYFSCIQVKYKGAVNDFAIFQGFYIYTGDSTLTSQNEAGLRLLFYRLQAQNQANGKLSAQMGFN